MCRLDYDKKTHTYTNSSNIEVRVPGLGRTDTVEFLDTAKQVGYFNKFIDYFTDKGYQRGVNICAAPYDWRLAPGEISIQITYYTLYIHTCTYMYTIVWKIYTGKIFYLIVFNPAEFNCKNNLFHCYNLPLLGQMNLFLRRKLPELWYFMFSLLLKYTFSVIHVDQVY